MEEKVLLKAISDMMDEKLEPVKEDIGELKQDVGMLEQDVVELKQDVGMLKQNVGKLEANVGILKENVEELNKKSVKMTGKIDMLQQRISELEFTMENKISYEIHLIAENHFFLNRQLEYMRNTWRR